MRIPKNFLAKLYILYLYKRYELIGMISILINKIVFGELLKVGRQPKIWGSLVIKIIGNGSIILGDDLHLVSETKRSFITLFSKIQLTAYGDGIISLGDRVALNGTVITSKKSISIGSGTMVAPNVIIVDSDFHQAWPPETRFISDTSALDKEVKIGCNVWIGMNTLVLKGSSIGDNSIIGAGSTVTGEIPPNCIAAGNPAIPIKFFTPQ
jgi:acetyltransferase-like isoleucine patch superfamily enzyme